METATVGKVIVSAKIENIGDLEDVYKGRISLDQVRRLELDDALVDTGTTTLSLPKRLIDQLGLRLLGQKQARTANGMATFGKYSTVRLTVQGRDCALDVFEVADGCPALIGVIALGTAALLTQLAWSGDAAFVGGPLLARVWTVANALVCLWLARTALDAKRA